MAGAMQHWPMRVSSLIDHAAKLHPGRAIVTRWADGRVTRTNWAGVREDALRMAAALRRMGVVPGDRVATLAMNHGAHLIAWYGATGAGAVLHTINPRLFDDQLDYIANHAEDRVLLYDAAFQPIVERLRARWTSIEHYICFDGPAPGALAFDDWIAGEGTGDGWTGGDERDPCMLCYTSGTTGHPKGVLFEHRSNLLHTLAAISPQCLDLDAGSTILPVVPMFHANNWSYPWSAAAVGAGLVYSQTNDAAALCDLVHAERVTHLAGVPTVWLALCGHCDATGQQLPPITHALTGGSAIPRALVERVLGAGIHLVHAWGMTETSPIATVTQRTADWDSLDLAARVDIVSRQGKPVYGVMVRCVSLDGSGAEMPWDGASAGALQVRGAWVIQRYFKAEEDAVDADGWFDTGDVAVIHPDGTLQLTDRTKDVIKSGGEWISSVELENCAVGHPAVAEAAAIGIAHAKWDERPLLVVVRAAGAECSAEELRGWLAQRVAKWWVPDGVEFVTEIPHTASGKISKKDLRTRFADYSWR